MQPTRWLALSLAVALGVASAAQAQDSTQSKKESQASVAQSVDAALVKPVYTIAPDGQVRLPDVKPAQYTPDGAGAAATKESTPAAPEAPAEEPLGPTPPENVKLLMDTGVGQWLDELGTPASGRPDMGPNL